MNNKAFTKYSIITIAGFSLFIATQTVLNYFADCFSVFHDKPINFETNFEPNTRFIKTQFLKNNCSNFNAIIFGNSRSAGFTTEDINEQFEAKSYNYCVSGETPLGILQKLKWLQHINCMPNTIFLPISIDRTQLIDYTKQSRLLRLEHPYISNQENNFFYRKNFLLSMASSKFNLLYIASQLTGKKTKLSYNFSTGDVTYLWDKKFNIKDCQNENRALSEQTIIDFAKVLTEIKQFANQHNSKVILAWTPQPISDQLAYDTRTLDLLFHSLSPYYQFIYRIPLSDARLKNNYFFHDPSHFKPELGKNVFQPANKILLLKLLEEIKEMKSNCT